MAASRRRAHLSPGALGRPILCAGLGDLLDQADDKGRVWVEVCLEGIYRGHARFPELAWTRQVFDQVVANFRENPGYKPGADGFGSTRLVPWDYEHSSEIAKANGAIPVGGLPAEAWTYDLEVRAGADGTAQLWALTEWLSDARQQILDGKYQYCSVAVVPHYVNPVTGVDQGPTLTSIALTNDPFIQGMEPIAATLEQWGPAESLLEVLVGLQGAFELPEEATAQQALAQVRAFLDAIAAGTVPEYVDESLILDRVRRLLKLPLLTPPEEILGGAEAALNELIAGGETGGALATPAQLPTENPMPTTLNTLLATLLRCEGSDQAILQAVQDKAKKAEVAEANAQAANAIEQLKALLGGTDVQEMLAKATQLMADAKKLEPALKALAEAQAALKEGAESDATAEAEAVAASLAGGDAALLTKFQPVILAARKACIGENGLVDPAKLEKFRADYPLKEEQRAMLTRRIVAAPNGVQLGGASTAMLNQPIERAGSGGASADVQAAVAEINKAPGRNHIERTNAYLCSHSDAHKALPFGEQVRKAGEFFRGIQEGKLLPV